MCWSSANRGNKGEDELSCPQELPSSYDNDYYCAFNYDNDAFNHNNDDRSLDHYYDGCTDYHDDGSDDNNDCCNYYDNSPSHHNNNDCA